MEFDPDNFTPSGSRGNVPAGFEALSSGAREFIRQYMPADDDQGAIGSFEWLQEFKPFLSRQAGHEIYEPVLYIRITIRGNDKLEVHRPATEADKRRFPFSWQEFQRGEDAAARGTALSKLPGIDPGMLRGYHAKNIFTIEDLALVSDANLGNIGLGGRELRKKAIDYVENLKATHGASEALARMQSIIDQERERAAKKDALLEQALQAIAELQKPKERKKPGPKKKTASVPVSE